MLEIFKLISDYPNYEVSNLGNVRNRLTGKVLRPFKNGKGYLRVDLCKNGKEKTFLVHRLVATAFIPNPDNKPQVNHIDGCKSNNYISNLEWCNSSENVSHSYRTGLSHTIVTDKNHFKTNNPNPKQKVRCIETQQEFESICDTARYFGCDHGSIRQSIYKGYKVLKKYHFELV